MSMRTTVLWVPDWPVVAAAASAEVAPHLPVAVHDGRRVTAVSALARDEGVRRGMRRREAQGVCPELELLPADDARDVRLFEPVAAAAETVVAGIEVVRAGLLLLPADGASRYHGSERALAERLVDAVALATGYECGVGTADGLLAAVLAARAGVDVPAGTSPEFLAARGVADLVHAAVTDEAALAVGELVDLLHRLGLRTLGQLAALPPADVFARFGRLGAWASTLARGQDERPPARRRPEQDLEAAAELDPPADRVDTATFAGRRLAEQLHAQLVEGGWTCGRLRIAARTDDGDELARTWRTDLGGWGGLSPARITDRIRWQLESWLSASAVEAARDRARDVRAAGGARSVARRHGAGGSGGDDAWLHPDAPEFPDDDAHPTTLVRLSVTALDVAPAGAEQGRLWGGPSGGDLRAHRALDRVQAVVGGSGVLVATIQGGRGPRDQVHVRPWGDQSEAPHPVDRPWPGRLPEPAPATVPVEAVAVEVRDAAGAPVLLGPRLALSAPPAWVRWVEPEDEEGDGVGPRGGRRGWSGDGAGARGDAGRRGTGPGVPGGPRGADGVRRAVVTRRVRAWAGPWPMGGRWWAEPEGPRATLRAYVQVAFDDGVAALLALGAAGWTCEATYD
ncbi:DNA polymerase Y family protein [Cellulomonas alba]|uniref:DNA polymerase Y family protein n=1 Tax=Cellulomonas alba TaxID=3053467 RepID=A0ABT7SJS2_9CELL|nr:DNA polymerase Y family protein [Cellulomonas alba]MDM7856434.1 DNA polymerase Y family protein [Cellulomonas alba]